MWGFCTQRVDPGWPEQGGLGGARLPRTHSSACVKGTIWPQLGIPFQREGGFSVAGFSHRDHGYMCLWTGFFSPGCPARGAGEPWALWPQPWWPSPVLCFEDGSVCDLHFAAWQTRFSSLQLTVWGVMASTGHLSWVQVGRNQRVSPGLSFQDSVYFEEGEGVQAWREPSRWGSGC